MKLSKKTFLNVLLILFILSFFVTPLGYYGKLFLNQLFAQSPEIIPEEQREVLADYNWRLKNEEWDFFSFEKSKGKVAIVVFWASWKLPACEAEMRGLQKLYDDYKGKVDFYAITNEERPPVEEFAEKVKITMPITYLIIGDKSPLEIKEPPASYIINKAGEIVASKEGISDWNSKKVRTLLDTLLR
ncbi:TlpA family protein disulfide reductase [Croceivirga thetidis]|uniref:TlpA family protein disulfide reductase n=1 Tax=Croceivirga thetidis TaxID=2721623 RepID=A0ABX1GU75_9FLAO|nr:TlpA disulfide reductase family protein [Croceivirga thetidis]NKI33503.1 TlpA family protein disulfide reductase [Croceivirga thetidis]